MARKWYDSEIVKIEQAGDQTRRFWLKIKQEDNFDFKAGQFITLDLPIHEKRLKRWRSYSIASPPDGSTLLELCIVKLEGGLASTYLFEKASIGTSIKFKGPGGVFFLPEKIQNKLVFICTGTGIAPFRSMILDLKNRNKLTATSIHLIFGTRTASNILYRKEMEKLAQLYPHFTYDIVLSREKVKGLHQGYVHSIYQQSYSPSSDNTTFYLCGWSNMVDEAVDTLKNKMNINPKHIIQELYG